MDLPRIVITGASGFIGRHLLESLKERFRIVGMARRIEQGIEVSDETMAVDVIRDVGPGGNRDDPLTRNVE